MIGLDYETYSDVELGGPNKRGLANYSDSPNFRALIVSIAEPNEEYTKFVTYDFVFDRVWYRTTRGRAFREVLSALADFGFALGVQGEYSNEDIVAHNATFERVVTNKIMPWIDPERFIDSAAEASMLGADRSLFLASRMLTHADKLEVGAELIQLFCVPNSYYPEGPTAELIRSHGHMDKWELFIEYCEIDALGGLEIHNEFIKFSNEFDPGMPERERLYEFDCFEMNQAGWHVDIPLVEKMKQRAWANGIIAQKQFVLEQGEGEQQVNFNSHVQLKRYCAERGVNFKSLDKYHLPLVLENVRGRIQTTEENMELDETYKAQELKRLREVELLLETKEEIGGSALSKLPVVLRLVDKDDLLKDQYLHIGAPQTFRTSSKDVQMQNLKRLGSEPRDMSTIYDFNETWTNGDMSDQLRQIFTSRHPEGKIIVGDFSSVESRGLAWLAGETWKLDAYNEGKDVYKVLASKFFDVPYEEVTKEQRPRGKYSELSCGYQSSAAVLQDFMFRLGFDVDIDTAREDVMNWREANPRVVEFWETLDQCLKAVAMGNGETGSEFYLGYHGKVRIMPFVNESVQAQHPGAMSLCIQIIVDKKPVVTRIIHGTYIKLDNEGRPRVCYYKPTDNKAASKLWKDTYQHPKLKDPNTGKPKEVLYSLYGGKLAGILTQSLCRELFMHSLHLLSQRLKSVPNAKIVGQFHDEIAVDWWPDPDGLSEEEVTKIMEECMSTTFLKDFPLTADIKSAYRYIK